VTSRTVDVPTPVAMPAPFEASAPPRRRRQKCNTSLDSVSDKRITLAAPQKQRHYTTLTPGGESTCYCGLRSRR
jgi:hypothetical protein